MASKMLSERTPLLPVYESKEEHLHSPYCYRSSSSASSTHSNTDSIKSGPVSNLDTSNSSSPSISKSGLDQLQEEVPSLSLGKVFTPPRRYRSTPRKSGRRLYISHGCQTDHCPSYYVTPPADYVPAVSPWAQELQRFMAVVCLVGSSLAFLMICFWFMAGDELPLPTPVLGATSLNVNATASTM